MKIIALFLVLFPLTAFAQIDPHPDGIGIYFDTEATSVVTIAETGSTVQAYLIGTNMSQPEYPLYPSSGSQSLPVAMINGDAPIATESQTMDSVKVLYR